MNKIEALKTKDNLQISDVSSKEVFGIQTDIKIPKFNEASEYCPKLDTNYVFDESTTIAILLGLKFNKRVFLQGLHGTGKSSHIAVSYTHLTLPTIYSV